MAGNKYIKNNAGGFEEVPANQTSAGEGDAGKIVALNSSGVLDSTIVNSKTSSAGAGDSGKLPALDGTGRLDNSFMPVGVGADTIQLPATEALAAGDYVNIYNATGTPSCRKADGSTTGKEAHGFVLASVLSAGTATIYLEGTNTQVTGMTAGNVFLSDSTAGAGTNTAPTTAGHIVQRLGVAVSATAVSFEPNPPILLA